MRAIVWFAGLAACRGDLYVLDSDTGVDDTDPQDTSEDTSAQESNEDVLVYEAFRGPPELLLALREAVDQGGCPTATVASATDFTLTGGCSRGTVAWTGSGTFRRTADGERIQFGTLAYDAGDGPIALTGEILVTGGTIDATHVGRDAAGELVFAHAHTTYTPDTAAVAVAAGGAGTYAIAGQLTIGGMGVFSLSGSVEHAGTCDREPDAGDLEATGSANFDFDPDGAASCDGCVPYDGGEACGF